MIFAAAGNLGGSKPELFPAHHQSVFSIRATNTNGKHDDNNHSLPEWGGKGFGTLGFKVPASNLRTSASQFTDRTGTSIATAVAAGIAAIVLGYINIPNERGPWDSIRRFAGFQNLLYELSTEPEVQKRFITLDNHSQKKHLAKFEAALSHS